MQPLTGFVLIVSGIGGYIAFAIASSSEGFLFLRFKPKVLITIGITWPFVLVITSCYSTTLVNHSSATLCIFGLLDFVSFTLLLGSLYIARADYVATEGKQGQMLAILRKRGIDGRDLNIHLVELQYHLTSGYPPTQDIYQSTKWCVQNMPMERWYKLARADVQKYDTVGFDE